MLGTSFHEYFALVEEDQRLKQQLKEKIWQRKKKIKARDITLAMFKNDKNATEDLLPSDNGDDFVSTNSQSH